METPSLWLAIGTGGAVTTSLWLGVGFGEFNPLSLGFREGSGGIEAPSSWLDLVEL